ncbi:MAG TPA: energy transducer TonB [Steroidobacteraceae bacterium]
MQRIVPFFAGLGFAALAAVSLAFQQPAHNGGDFSDQTHPVTKVPPNTLIVKGAWTASSDSITPDPEGGTLTGNTYDDPYFGLEFTLPANWTKMYDGPPPSDSGYYSLLQLIPVETARGISGNVLISAQDLFFTPSGATTTEQLIRFSRDHLQADYRVEREPSQVQLAGRSFMRFDYVAAAAGLHWRVLATQIRCHTLQFIFTSRDPKLLETLTRQAERMKLPPEAGLSSSSGGGTFPECVPDYARDANILERVEPVFTERRFNPVPVRILIDREGKVKHIHLLSAFPDQSRSVIDALRQWRFKPYLRDGVPVEVETGIYFGHVRRPLTPRDTAASGQ